VNPEPTPSLRATPPRRGFWLLVGLEWWRICRGWFMLSISIVTTTIVQTCPHLLLTDRSNPMINRSKINKSHPWAYFLLKFVSGQDLKPLKVGQNPKRRTYAWHRIIYTEIIPVLLLSIASELAMYKPAQLHWLSGLFIN
jgi:thiosulfate reductase cytochrome b subunit